MDMKIFGQRTNKDCWISSTIVAIFLSIDFIPRVIVKDNIVIFPNDRKIILTSIPNNYKEAIIRSVRVYFSNINNNYQSKIKMAELNNFGCPDRISELFFNKKFDIFSTSRLSLYPYINLYSCRTELIYRQQYDIFLLTFNFNRSHLYVYSSYIQNGDLVSVIDISNNDINMVCIPINKIHILMKLNIKPTCFHGN